MALSLIGSMAKSMTRKSKSLREHKIRGQSTKSQRTLEGFIRILLAKDHLQVLKTHTVMREEKKSLKNHSDLLLKANREKKNKRNLVSRVLKIQLSRGEEKEQ